jgi:YidC/Oxa1 family membrane protein insertase
MRLFAGAKEVQTIDFYDKALGLNRFELLIDWGWFYFITKPLFKLIDWFFHFTGNFGLAILIVTVLIKIVFFSALPNKSYASMAKMKAVQPGAEYQEIRDFVRTKSRAALLHISGGNFRKGHSMLIYSRPLRRRAAVACLDLLPLRIIHA